MANPIPLDLGRRERQIMEAVYAQGRSSVKDVLRALPDPPTYSTVRAMLNMLVDKGHLRRRKEGKRFLYLPTVAREKVSRSALRKLIATFFDGSVSHAVAALIEMDRKNLSDQDLERLSRIIENAKKGER